MKLYEFKAKFMSRLTVYDPRTEKERELRDMLIVKLNNLRTMTLPSFVLTLYEIIEHENVSDEFKKLCREMIEYVDRLERGEE